jgi:hypothetical protein
MDRFSPLQENESAGIVALFTNITEFFAGIGDLSFDGGCSGARNHGDGECDQKTLPKLWRRECRWSPTHSAGKRGMDGGTRVYSKSKNALIPFLRLLVTGLTPRLDELRGDWRVCCDVFEGQKEAGAELAAQDAESRVEAGGQNFMPAAALQSDERNDQSEADQIITLLAVERGLEPGRSFEEERDECRFLFDGCVWGHAPISVPRRESARIHLVRCAMLSGEAAKLLGCAVLPVGAKINRCRCPAWC